MPFPYPSDPNEWQTCYTRERAYVDSVRRIGAFSVPTVLLIVVPSLYIVLYISFRQEQILGAGVIPFLLALGLIAVPLALAIFGLFALLRASTTFIKDFYHPPSNANPMQLIRQRLVGVPPLPPPLSSVWRFPYLLIRDVNLDPPNHSATWLGGPALLIVFDGYALYLERGNRFSRIVGAGKNIPFLEIYETIKAIVDLRPQVKIKEYGAWTKDGIRIVIQIRLEFRIKPPASEKTDEQLVYPYDPAAIRRAVDRTAVRFDHLEKKLVEYDWQEGVWGQAQGILADYVSRHFLDDLFLAKRVAGQIFSSQARAELLQELKEKANSLGVDVTDLQITRVAIPEQVNQQRLRFWEAERQKLATITAATAKAYEIRTREKARAEAQRDVIVAVAEGIKKAALSQVVPSQVDPSQLPESLLLSLSDILDQGLKDPLTRTYITKETIETLEKLKVLI